MRAPFCAHPLTAPAGTRTFAAHPSTRGPGEATLRERASALALAVCRHTGTRGPARAWRALTSRALAEGYVVATVASARYGLMLDTRGARSTLPLDDLTSTFARVDVDDESPSWAQRRGGLHEPA